MIEIPVWKRDCRWVFKLDGKIHVNRDWMIPKYDLAYRLLKNLAKKFREERKAAGKYRTKSRPRDFLEYLFVAREPFVVRPPFKPDPKTRIRYPDHTTLHALNGFYHMHVENYFRKRDERKEERLSQRRLASQY